MTKWNTFQEETSKKIPHLDDVVCHAVQTETLHRSLLTPHPNADVELNSGKGSISFPSFPGPDIASWQKTTRTLTDIVIILSLYLQRFMVFIPSHVFLDSVEYYGGFSGMEQTVKETLVVTCCSLWKPMENHFHQSCVFSCLSIPALGFSSRN